MGTRAVGKEKSGLGGGGGEENCRSGMGAPHGGRGTYFVQ